MECPFCGKIDNEVTDSRLTKEGIAIRRRRRCLDCRGRFTTFESTAERLLLVLMKKHVGQGRRIADTDRLLRFIASALKGLAEDMQKSVDKLHKPAPVKEAKKPKGKVAVSPKKEVLKKEPAARRAKRLTVAAEVVRIIKRHKKGVDITTLKDRTGLADYKIRNILYRAHKEGKIRRIARGVYAPA